MRVLGIASAVLVLMGLGIWWWLQPSDFVLVVKVLDNQTGEADPSDVGRFTVQLSNNPRDTINLQLSSSSPDQGVPELDSLTFTGSDWAVPKNDILATATFPLQYTAAGEWPQCPIPPG